AAGASMRTRSRNRSCASARSIARSRSGRSGWPTGVRCLRQAGWVMRRVGITLIRETDPCLPFACNAHPWRRPRLVGHEEGWRERLAGVHAIFLEVGDALGGEKGVVDQKMTGEAACRFLEHEIGRIREDFGGARHPHHPLAAEQVLDCRGRKWSCVATVHSRRYLCRAARPRDPARRGSYRTWQSNRPCCPQTTFPACRAAVNSSKCGGSPLSRDAEWHISRP